MRPLTTAQVLARAHELDGMSWPGDSAQRVRVRAIGWPVMEWMLRRAHDPAVPAMTAMRICWAMAHLAPALDDAEARMAALVLRPFSKDPRALEFDARAADGDPQALDELRSRPRPSVAEAAAVALEQVLRTHPGIDSTA